MQKMDWPVMEVFRVVDRAALAGILDSVRTRVLDWALQLEQDGILGEGMSFTNSDKQKAQATQSIYIQNFTGVLGDVSESTVTVHDAKQIGDRLRQTGLNGSDVDEISKLMALYASTPESERPRLRVQAKSWISEHAIEIGALVVQVAGFFGLGPGAAS
jgi:alkylation response protein AidB-like acyl-CoA dehydrogenase